MKTSCFGSRVSCSFRNALRAAATSGRSCSAACRLFFKGQVDVVEEPRNPRLAHLHFFFRQANLKLCKRTIRLFRYKLLNPICMWLKRESLVPAELVRTDTVAMEATGVFWKPVWHILDDAEFELVLANAAHVKNVPGRKT